VIILKKYDVLTSGYVSLDRIINVLSPLKVGFTSIVENSDNSKIYYGGCPVNIAYNLARLGLRSMPYIRVGSDYKETGLFDFLKQANVYLDAVEVVENESTSNCYLIEDVEKNHVTIFYPGAMNGKYAKEMKDEFFENTGLGVMTVGAFEDNSEFFSKCKKHDIPLIFGMKCDLTAFPKEFLLEVLEYSKVIFMNQSERETIEHLYKLNSVTDFFKNGKAEIIVVTLGKRGSICYTKTENGFDSTEIRIARCEKVVDTSGSGDAYMSGFIYGFLKGYPPVECCNFGSILASFIVEKKGCCTNAPDEKQLLERYGKFLEKRK
jgi:adenosine kinase